MRTIKWVIVGVVVVAITLGVIYACNHFSYLFITPSTPGIIDTIDDSGRVDDDIAGVGDSIDSGGRILDELDDTSERSRESASEIADSSSQLEGQLTGIRDDAERAQAAIDAGWGAKRKLDELIFRLQGKDKEGSEEAFDVAMDRYLWYDS